MPNAFAPARDSENGNLAVFPGPGNWELAEFAVYDRWGNLLFQSTAPLRYPETLVWDGRVWGDLVQPGVLTWAAKLQLPGGAVTWRSGDVTVVR